MSTTWTPPYHPGQAWNRKEASIAALSNANPNHDELGRFSTGDAAADAASRKAMDYSRGMRQGKGGTHAEAAKLHRDAADKINLAVGKGANNRSLQDLQTYHRGVADHHDRQASAADLRNGKVSAIHTVS